MNGLKPEEVVQLRAWCRTLRELSGGNLSIETRVVDHIPGKWAMARARVVSHGTFSATGTADVDRDPGAQLFVEIAEARAILRAVTMAAGFDGEAQAEDPGPIPFPREKIQAATSRDDAQPARIIPGPPATPAQIRCIRTMAKRIHMDPHAAVARLVPGAELDRLTLGAASEVIDELQRRSSSGK